MDFLEAVKALQDGRCKKIKSSSGTTYSKHKDTISLEILPFGEHSLGICLPCESFLGEWKLIGVKQKIVIENVLWKETPKSAVYPTAPGATDWNALLKQPAMKMTLEWEE